MSKLPFLIMEGVARLVRLRVEGAEALPSGGYVLCPTHQGDLDPYLIRRAVGDPFWRAKRHQFFYRLRAPAWVRRLFLAHWGGQIVSDSDSDSDSEDRPNTAALRRGLDHLKCGRPLVIFPEGQAHGRGRLYEGAAYLACRAGVPLVPLRIRGGVFVPEETPLLLFPWRVAGAYLRHGRRVRLTFLDPLQPDRDRFRRLGRRYVEALTRELGERLGILNADLDRRSRLRQNGSP